MAGESFHEGRGVDPIEPLPERPLLCVESWLALLIGVVFGLAAILYVPPFFSYDGPHHFLRALQVSQGDMRAERYSDRALGGSITSSHSDFLTTMLWDYYVRNGLTDYMTRGEWESVSSRYVTTTGSRLVQFTNTAVYSPVNYAFQAVGMKVAAALSPEPLLANWLGCLFNLAGYLFLAIAAIECAPHFRRGILLLASCPLPVIQAASLSADPINFALPLLVLAWTWRLRVHEVKHPAAELAALLIVALPVALLKPTEFPILLCLVLLPSRMFGRPAHAKAAALGLYFLMAAGIWLAWNQAYLDVDLARWFDPRQPAVVAVAQRQWFLENPLRFTRPFLHFLRHGLIGSWPALYSDVGNWVPPSSYAIDDALSVIVIAGLLGCASWHGAPSRVWAAGLAVISFIFILLTGLTLWLKFGTPGMGRIPDMYGRYLVVPAMALGIAWAEMFHGGFGKTRSFLFWSALAANAAGLCAILVPTALRTG